MIKHVKQYLEINSPEPAPRFTYYKLRQWAGSLLCLLSMSLLPLRRPLQTLILSDECRGTAGAIPKIFTAVHRRIGNLACSRVGTKCVPYSCRLHICLYSL